jgi:hypothetical protein
VIAVVVLAVLAVPTLLLIGLLKLIDVRDRRRHEVVTRQILLTDAIHGVLGPVVAPFVRRGRGRWIADLALPAGSPYVGTMVALAHDVLGQDAEIVLSQLPAARAPHRRPAVTSIPALSGARFTR